MAMAKGAQAAAARIMTEVMPPEVVSIMRGRKVPIGLDTIAEADEREQQQLANQTAAAWAKRAAPQPQPQPQERAVGLLRELSKYFADGGYGGGGSWSSWESGRHGHRRAAYVAQPLRIKSGPYMGPYVLGY